MLNDARLQAIIATTDGDRARAFFEGVLGLPVLRDDSFGLTFECAGGARLRVAKVESFSTAAGTAAGWEVPNVVAAARELTQRGVVFERYPGMQQDDLGVWSAPGGGHVAWFKDPDGNTLSISGMQA